jgi:hypothetical protein
MKKLAWTFLALALCGACDRSTGRTEAPQVADALQIADRRTVPQILFWIEPVIPTTGSPIGAVDTAWSGNDDRDSIRVLVAGASPGTRASARIDVGVVEQPADPHADLPPIGSRFVTWRTITDFSVDSLPAVAQGQRLAVISVADLPIALRAILKPHDSIEAIYVVVTPRQGAQLIGKLVLLYPI